LVVLGGFAVGDRVAALDRARAYASMAPTH
jgi:hypothetical protein